MKLGELASRLDCTLEGDPQIEIKDVAGVDDAAAGDVTFFVNRKYRDALVNSRASAVFVAKDEVPAGMAALRSPNPYLAFARAIEIFHPAPAYAPGIHPTTVIAKSARIADGAHVGPYCFIDEGVALGKNAVLHSFVSIYRDVQIDDNFFAHSHVTVREECRIGKNVILQNGVTVGSDGFGFARHADGRWHKMRQSGITVIGDDVEIQAHSVVDRATVGQTVIARGAKLDNLVQVGHACEIGENTLLCGQVGLAGTTKVGNNCVLAGQVGAAGHLKIGDGATITAQSGIPNDVPPGAIFSGCPAVDNRDWRKSVAVFNRLPELQRELQRLRAEVSKLTAP
jgi:UDP-3-O-[3-hydroxymyristoyl] glucosamine N-acyltransferase